jgi:hypothetical protein
MLRKAALLACLAAPLAAGAQTPVAGTITFAPNAIIGAAECASSTDAITLTWTTSVVTGGSLQNAFYRIQASNTASCPDTDVVNGRITGLLVDNLTPTAFTQAYPSGLGDTPILHSDLAAAAGYDCASPDSTIYVCVELLPIGTGTALGSATGTVKLQLTAPPAPSITGIVPGDKALTIAWQDGPDNGTAAASYRVEAQADDPLQDAALHEGTTSSRSLRLSGLKNLSGGAQYRVVVYARSEGENESPASAPAFETPQPVQDFWDYYAGSGGQEQGGCGGPAGALSLLSLAAVAGLLRRRS